MITPCPCIYSRKLIIGIMVCIPSLNAMNSAPVKLRTASVCIFDAHVSGQPAYFFMYPVLDPSAFNIRSIRNYWLIATLISFSFLTFTPKYSSTSPLLVISKYLEISFIVALINLSVLAIRMKSLM